MTDTAPAAVERFNIETDLHGETEMSRCDAGYYVSYSDCAALSAQLQAANKRADTAHTQGKAEGLREAAAQLECRYNIALKISDADLLSDWKSHVASAWGQASAMVLALIPADTPACDTKTAENAPQAGLCVKNDPQEAAKVTVQEAAKVLLDLLQTPSEKAPIEPRRIEEIWDATFRKSGFNAVNGFLRAIAGGRDE